MKSKPVSRREFLETTGTAAAAVATGTAVLPKSAFAADESGNKIQVRAAGSGKNVALVCDPADTVAAAPAPQWALGQLRDALASRGVAVQTYKQISETKPGEFCIVATSPKSKWFQKIVDRAGMTIPTTPETVALGFAGVDDRMTMFAAGSDARGLTYALLEVADRVARTDPPLGALESQKPLVETPANAIRSIARLFASDVEDKPWFNSKPFWREYLTMLAAERFNRFNLTLGLGYDFTRQIKDAYFYFAYPFLLAVEGYNVRAVGLSDEERDNNLAMLRFISEEAVARGLDFQLGIWTHAYHWTDSPQVNFNIDGLNADNHANYCRDALAALLKACPAISGVTIRTHGESGVPEGSYEFWETIFDGAKQSGRSVEIDLHAKGIDQRMIDGALKTGLPVNISPKFWAEHMGLPYHQASIRALEMPPPAERKDEGMFSKSNGSRRFLRYSYGDLLREDRQYGVLFRVWPGTQRLLLWGSPAMAAAIGRTASFCGSKGLELCEPLSFKGRKGSGLTVGRTAYADKQLEPKEDWEKYRYSYRLWGRLLFNPDSEPETWQRLTRHEWGAEAPAIEKALSHASRILPLVTSAHLPSAANNNYWPEMYVNMSISDATLPTPYGDSPTPRRFGTVSPLDPMMFSTIDQSAGDLLNGQSSGKVSPAEVAKWLEDLAEVSTKNLGDADQKSAKKNPEYRRMQIDVKLQSGLGRFFAHKFRAGLLYAVYDRTGDRSALEEALKQYRAARDAWVELAHTADGVYVRDVTFGPENFQRGHWSLRLSAIDQDVARMAKLVEQVSAGSSDSKSSGRQQSNVDPERVQTAVRAILSPSPRPTAVCQHQPPKSFRGGDVIPISLAIDKSKSPPPTQVELHYRQVHQAETYQTAALEADGNRWITSIPAAYTQSPYPLQYFFELRTDAGDRWRFPDLGVNLCQQPYFVIRQS